MTRAEYAEQFVCQLGIAVLHSEGEHLTRVAVAFCTERQLDAAQVALLGDFIRRAVDGRVMR